MRTIILIVLWMSLGLACTSTSKKNEADKVKQATESTSTAASTISEVLAPQAFVDKLKEKPEAQLLDIRTSEELAETGKIEGALHMDFYANDFKTKLLELNKEQAVFVYCRSGGRSGKSAKMLKNAGFKEVYDLEGGMTKWTKESKPVVK